MHREQAFSKFKAALVVNGYSVEERIRLSNIFIQTMEGYEISNRCTEVATIETESDNILKLYAGTLLTEGKSKRTVSEYVASLRRFKDDINKPLTQVSTFDVRAWLLNKQQSVSLRTCENYRSYLSAFYQWLLAEEIIEKIQWQKLSL